LLTNAFSGLVSNACFSFAISDGFVSVVGFKWAGAQYAVSALCFTVAVWNTHQLFNDPEISKFDVVANPPQGTRGQHASPARVDG
jgi:hypothetical protein